MRVVMFSAKNCGRTLFVSMRSLELAAVVGRWFRGLFVNDHATEGVCRRQEDKHGMA